MSQPLKQTAAPLRFSAETITPQIAGSLLGTMVGNRPLRRKAVDKYAREMIAGRWRLNGEAIKVSRSGRLLDGQHRLNAVIVANVSVQMHVLRGVEDEDIVTLDTGVGRSYYDVGVIRGDQAHRLIGPAARWWYGYEQGSPASRYSPTHQELDDVVDRHPVIRESAAFVNKLRVVRSRCIPAVQAFVHSYATEKWDRDVADLFMHSLNDGTALKNDDPIWHLRRRLVDDDTRGRIENHYVLALSIKAWNAWIAGETIGSLRWRTGGDNPEPFPRFSRDITPAVLSADRVAARSERAALALAEIRNTKGRIAAKNGR